MRARLLVILCALVMLVANQSRVPVSAQTSGASGTNRASSTNGVIRGRVTAADTRRPLRRAQVVLTGSDTTAPRQTNTGIDGRYEFTDVPAGRYTLSVSRSGYLSLRHGQRRPLEQARPLQLAERQAFDDVDFVLPRMGVIAGRVLDDLGDPIAGVRVQALRPAWVEGRRQLVIAAMTAFQGTDDTGAYRLTGLPPGRYYVRASTRETWTVAVIGRRDLMGFTPTFFPSTPSVADARLVEVGVGQRVTDANVFLLPGRPARVAGWAFDSRGRPLAGRMVNMGQRFLRETPGGGGAGAGSAPVGADGSFSFRSVVPGEYQLAVTTGDVATGEGETVRVDVVVDGTDIDNIRLMTSAGWSVAGRVVTDDGSMPAFPRDAVRVGATPVRQDPASLRGVEVKEDWTFRVPAIIGPARLWVDVPDGWMVKNVRVDGQDITSMPLDPGGGQQLAEVEVIVTSRPTRIIGRVSDDRTAPVPDGTIIAFAEDNTRWGEGSVFVRTARADQDGEYEITGLPPGDYLAVALDYVEDGLWNDPEYLESLRQQAHRFMLADGGFQTLSLRVSGR